MGTHDIKIDPTDLLALSERPPLYAEGTSVFWQDPYIAAQLLEAHLDPTNDIASKKHETIDAEVAFIADTLGLAVTHSIIDLGCGPGLYCERFSRYCGHVTGVDFSQHSIEYATVSAQEKGLDITYRHLNYLELEAHSAYDAACMINYDFGALPGEDMHILLDNIHRALKPGGFFVFDVLTPSHTVDTSPTDWYVSPGGFWRPDTHLVLEKRFGYPDGHARLTQYIVVTPDGHTVYRIYETVFTAERIETLLNRHGLAITHIYNDLGGTALLDDTEILGIFAQRIG